MKKLFVLLAVAFLLAGPGVAADKPKGASGKLKYKIEYGKIAGDVTLVSRIKPDYPKELRQAGVQGEVRIGFTVNGDGSVSNVSALSFAHPELTRHAENAVRRWRFVGTYSAPGTFSWITTSVAVKFRLLDGAAKQDPPAAPRAD